MVELYKREHYSFIGITDHRVYYNQTHLLEDFVILNGCEYNCYLDLEGYERIHFHLLSLQDQTIEATYIGHDDNTYKSLFYTQLCQVQQLIDEIKSFGNIVIIAHPKNNLIPLEIMAELLHYDGIEVYNAKAKSDASDYFEKLIITHNLVLTAVDDTHQLIDENGLYQNFKGFIILENQDISNLNVIKAIKDKKFYASTGAVINKIMVDENNIMIDANDIKKCLVYTYGSNMDPIGILDTNHNHFVLEDDVRFFRIECVDNKNHKAWTNILFCGGDNGI